MRRPSLTAAVITGSALIAFVVWTGLVLGGVLDGIDARTVHQPPPITTGRTQIVAALAVLTYPAVLYAGLLGLAVWAHRRRLLALRHALWLAVVLGWGGHLALKWLIHRVRPDTPLELVTTSGWAYPSGHVVAITVAVGMISAAMVVTRRGADLARGWLVGGPVLVVLVALQRWYLQAHWLSDLVGGVLWGVLATSASLVLAGVTVLPAHLRSLPGASSVTEALPETGGRRRCAVIYNPTKVRDVVTFQRHIEYELRSRGWERAIWLETTKDDPGREMTRIAVRKNVSLVLGAGGDGTTRVICSGLAGTGIPFGLIPAGTGNLLAKNLGIPLDERAALDVAFNGRDTPIDLVRLTAGERSEHFCVMAGIGIDAVIMEGTDANLKKAVGSAAYFVSAAQHANHPPVHATITVDDHEPFKRRASVIVLGNVGFLQGKIPLIPEASASDGLLDLMIASPRTVGDWVRLTGKVLTRRDHGDDQLDRLVARTVHITIDRTDPYQLDGDTVGACNEMLAEVEPGALTLRMPR